MSLEVKYRSEGPYINTESSSDFLDSDKLTIKKTKGNPDYNNVVSKSFSPDLIVGVIHLPYLSVNFDGKALTNVICLPKEITLEVALRYIRQYGQTMAERLIKNDSNKCLLFNIIYHVGSFEELIKILPQSV